MNYEEYKSNNLISEQLSFQIWTHRTLPVHNKSPTIAFSLMKYWKTLLTHAKLWHYHSFISNFTQFLWVSYLRSRIFIVFSLLFVGKVRHLKYLSKNWNAGYFVFCEIEDVNYSTALLYLQITIFKHWAKCCVS